MIRLALFALLIAAPASAQERIGEVLEPPRSETGEAYRTEAKSAGIAVDARTLSADAPLTLRPPETRPEERGLTDVDLSDASSIWRLIGWILLVAVVALIVVALLQTRFADLFRRDEPVRKPPPRKVELADVGTIDLSDTRLSDLAGMDDPREALRLLLLMGLARAADANDIRLRRSLTARDVFARVPGAWRMRETLGAIVSRAELVLFGGRPFSHADLAPLIELAEPMLRSGLRTGSGRGRRR